MNYSIHYDINNLVFVYNFENILVPIKNGTAFENGNKLYANFYLNITKNIKIKVKEAKPSGKEDGQNNNGPDDNEPNNNKFPIWAIILLIIGVWFIIISITLIIILKIRKKNKSESIEEKTEGLQPIES